MSHHQRVLQQAAVQRRKCLKTCIPCPVCLLFVFVLKKQTLTPPNEAPTLFLNVFLASGVGVLYRCSPKTSLPPSVFASLGGKRGGEGGGVRQRGVSTGIYFLGGRHRPINPAGQEDEHHWRHGEINSVCRTQDSGLLRPKLNTGGNGNVKNR